MANVLKKAMGGLFDRMLTSGKVIGVKKWKPETMVEIEVEVPNLKMEKWKTIHRVKCRVADGEYRDYTPTLWNAEEGTFKLFVEAGHDGAGSRWAQQLKPGDEILLGAVHSAQIPVKQGKILCLVDLSALGHALSLKQLLDQPGFPMETAVFLHDHFEVPENLLTENPEFEFLYEQHGSAEDVLGKWLESKTVGDYESICIAGNHNMTSGLRKKLKAIPEIKSRILVQGFWW